MKIPDRPEDFTFYTLFKRRVWVKEKIMGVTAYEIEEVRCFDIETFDLNGFGDFKPEFEKEYKKYLISKCLKEKLIEN